MARFPPQSSTSQDEPHPPWNMWTHVCRQSSRCILRSECIFIVFYFMCIPSISLHCPVVMFHSIPSGQSKVKQSTSFCWQENSSHSKSPLALALTSCTTLIIRIPADTRNRATIVTRVIHLLLASRDSSPSLSTWSSQSHPPPADHFHASLTCSLNSS